MELRMRWFHRGCEQCSTLFQLLQQEKDEVRRLTNVLIQQTRGAVAYSATTNEAEEEEPEDDLEAQILEAVAMVAESEDEADDLTGWARQQAAIGRGPSEIAHEILEGKDYTSLLE